MKVYEVRPDKDCHAHIEDSLGSALITIGAWLTASDTDTELTVKVLDMSQEEYDDLPEYEGP